MNLSFFFSYFLPLPPLPLKFIFHFAPQSSQSLCQMEINRGCCSPIEEASQGGTAMKHSSPVLFALRLPGCTGPPGDSCLALDRLLFSFLSLSPNSPESTVRPSSHTLSIRSVYFFRDSRHIWSTYSGYSSATRRIPQDHFSGCYGDLLPSSDFQVA